MDIKTEREAFENKFPVPAHWIDFDGLTCKYICKYNAIDDQALKYQARWESWLVAKAQAVPEGFVLVPKERLANVVDGIEKLFEEDCTLTLGELLPIQQDLKAIIEAQEQSHENG